MDNTTTLRTILANDPCRWHALGVVRSLHLPDCWIGAGFIRTAVWDHLHGLPATPPSGDVDVIWFDPLNADPSVDRALEAKLRLFEPNLDWSVKNQARMHGRNGDAPYVSSVDALRRWPETATAVAARRTSEDDFEVAAPYGLDDLFALIVRPTPCFLRKKHAAYLSRVRTKNWLEIWPNLRIEQNRQAGSEAPGQKKWRC